MDKTPKYQDEIYFHDSYNDRDAVNAAEAKGFKFFTWGSHATWFAISNHGTDHSNSGRIDQVAKNPGPVLNRVMEYLAQPERSERGTVLRALEEAGFFHVGVTNEGRITILNNLLETTGFCTPGKNKFKAFMGDSLPEPEPKLQEWTVTLTLPERWNKTDVETVMPTALSAIFDRWAKRGEDVRTDWNFGEVGRKDGIA